MPGLGPISRDGLIRAFRQLGFTGPYVGARHSQMARGSLRVRIPNPHRGDIDVSLLRRILDQAGISRQEWENL
ncbi:MAG: type II toxin-antitoxin system HicA family toxin [Chloroflexota bacterium]